MSSSLGINDSNNSVKDNRSIVSDSLTIKSYDNHAGNTEKVSTTSHESATSLISMLSPSKLSPSKWFQGKNTISNDSSIVDENLSSEQDDLSLISELRLQVSSLNIYTVLFKYMLNYKLNDRLMN